MPKGFEVLPSESSTKKLKSNYYMFQNLLFPELQSSCHKRANAYISEHNKCQGQEGLKYHIRDGAKLTFDKILAKYNKKFWKDVQSPLWADSCEMPTVWIGRPEISSLTGCKVRTAGDRIAKFCCMGMIKVHAKGDLGYKISLNPYFLFGSDAENPPKIQKMNFEGKVKFTIFLTPEVQSLHTLYCFKTTRKDNKYKAEEIQISNKSDRTDKKNYGRKNTIPVNGQIPAHSGDLKDSYPQKNENVKLGGGSMPSESINEAEAKRIVANLFGGNDSQPKTTVKSIDFQEIANERVSEPTQEERISRLESKLYGKGDTSKSYLSNNQRLTERDKVQFVNDFYEHMMLKIYPKLDLFGAYPQKVKDLIRSEVFNSFAGDNDYLEWRVQRNINMAILDQHAKYNDEHSRDAYFPTSWLKRYDSNGKKRKANFHCTAKFLGKSRRVLLDELKEDKLTRAIEAMVNEKYPKKLRTPEKQNLENLYYFWFLQLSKTTSVSHTARFYEFINQYYFTIPQEQKNGTNVSFAND